MTSKYDISRFGRSSELDSRGLKEVPVVCATEADWVVIVCFLLKMILAAPENPLLTFIDLLSVTHLGYNSLAYLYERLSLEV